MCESHLKNWNHFRKVSKQNLDRYKADLMLLQTFGISALSKTHALVEEQIQKIHKLYVYFH